VELTDEAALRALRPWHGGRIAGMASSDPSARDDKPEWRRVALYQPSPADAEALLRRNGFTEVPEAGGITSGLPVYNVAELGGEQPRWDVNGRRSAVSAATHGSATVLGVYYRPATDALPARTDVLVRSNTDGQVARWNIKGVRVAENNSHTTAMTSVTHTATPDRT
jgi:hypothetical protein